MVPSSSAFGVESELLSAKVVRDVEAAVCVGGPERPHESRLRFAGSDLHDPEPRLVCHDEVALASHVNNARPHRREERRGSVKQLVRRRSRDGNALARAPSRGGGSASGRPFGDTDVREEARPVLPLLDDLRRAWRGDDAATTPAAQHLLHVLVSDEPGRHEFPHESALAGRIGVRSVRPQGGAPTERLRHFVLGPHSWGLGFGLGPRAALGLRLLGRRQLAELHPRQLAPLAPRTEQRLLQLRVLVLELRDPRRAAALVDDGQVEAPFSRRLRYSTTPDRAQKRILTLSFALPANTNRWPSQGSRRSVASTLALRPSMPLRMSVGSTAK